MPDAPTNFVVSRAGIDHFYQGVLTNKAAVKLAWTNNAPGAVHRIQKRRNGVSGWVNAFVAGDGQSVAYLHGLALSAHYSLRIRAEDVNGAFSAWVSVADDPHITAAMPTQATQIDPPANFTVAQNDYRGVLFTWSDSAGNESSYIIHLDGPGANGIEIAVDHLLSGSKLVPLASPTGTPILGFSKTYTAKLKARGGKQTKPATTLDTDWTADVVFTTAPPHIAITNLPIPDDETPVVLRGQPFTFAVVTNTPPTLISIVGGALPAGLALATGTISGTTVAADGIYTVSIKAEDALTNDTQALKLRVATPAFNFTNLPATVVAWKSVAFLFRLLTNTPASSITQLAGALPAGLGFAEDTISGTSTAADGSYPLVFRADNALTSTTSDFTIIAQTPAIIVKVKPAGSASVPKAGPDWGEIAATLGATFDWEISASAFGPINVGSTITIDNAPDWLVLNGTHLFGAPDVSGVWDVQVNWTNGTFTGSTILRIRVKPVQITSANELTVYEDEPFSFRLTSTPHAVFSTDDDLPPDVEIFSPEVGDQFLRGTARVVGDYAFQIDATAGAEQDSQDFALHVLPLITLGNGTNEIEGWPCGPLLEELIYHGPCEVEAWYLSCAPPGVEIGTLGCPGAYEGSRNIVAITGTPTVSGFYDATVTAHVCCNGMPALHRFDIRFAVNGGLFLAWLHDDPTLYDLQFQIRGDVLRRQVQSWYQREAHGESKSSSTTKDTTTTGVERTTSSETNAPAVAGNILTAKRGDHLRLALLIRDGRDVLGTADGIANVAIAFRLPDSADEEYLFDLPGVPTMLNGHEFFLVEFDVTQELLDELMGDDSVSGSSGPAIESLAEIRCTLNGIKISSATFPVTFVEDVER